MRRREFIATLAAATAIGRPHTARAQQRTLPVIGYLHSGDGPLPGDRARFAQGLKESGFIEGDNVKIEFRFAHGQYRQLPALAAELVHERVAVILTTGGVAPALAAKAATSTIPIVFVHGSDPVKTGLVGSLNRPEANVTGVSFVTGALQAKALAVC